MLVLDLFVFHRKAHEVKIREALLFSAFWIALAVIFGICMWFAPQIGVGEGFGPEKAKLYFLGYVIEKALSVDNLFVFVVLFTFFKIPSQHQHRLLFWGVFGALVLRAIFIVVGVTLMNSFTWLMYVFGVILILTGLKLGFGKESEPHPEKNIVIRIARKILPVSHHFEGSHFTTRIDGKFYFTPMFLVLLLVETTDVIFAVDSIPAVMGVAQEVVKDPVTGAVKRYTDSFIVYTSNVFAILGLRALYFALAGIMGMFRFLKPALAFILAFIGAKMLAADYLHTVMDKTTEITISLSVVFGTLTLAIILSLLIPPKPAPHGEVKKVEPGPDPEQDAAKAKRQGEAAKLVGADELPDKTPDQAEGAAK
ncbi:MAG: TerC family protein [Planctomycetes bacterium]|nr:TerC family protein [Planctomycetota bacterium]